MKIIKLTQLKKTLDGEIDAQPIYVNAERIKTFQLRYIDSFEMFVTGIDFGQVATYDTLVKETPDEILELLNLPYIKK